MKLAYEILVALAWMLIGGVLMMSAACADDRLTRIALAWNAGDQAATQADFDRSKPREMAEMGSIVKGRLTVEKVKPIDMSLYQLQDSTLAEVSIDGVKHVWMIDNCKDDATKYCGFWHKPVSEIANIGHMEYGQAADVASTAIGLSQGLAEGNPLGGSGPGLVWLGAYKAFWIAYARSGEMDLPTCIGTRTAWGEVGYGSAINNLAAMAGAGTGIGIGLGVLAAVLMHDTVLEAATWECARFTLDAPMASA